MLARLSGLAALHQTYGVVGLTVSVYGEVVTRGKEKGIRDADAVEAATTQGWLSVLELTATEKRFAHTLMTNFRGLSRADCETLACARERGLTLLMEERRGRNVARTYAIPYITIQVFPLYGLIQGSLSVTQCDALLVSIGQTIRTDLAVLEALRAAAREIGRTTRKE